MSTNRTFYTEVFSNPNTSIRPYWVFRVHEIISIGHFITFAVIQSNLLQWSP